MNKKGMFKVLSTVVAFIMMLQLILTGCGKKDTGAANSTQTPQTAIESPTKDFVTVSWYLPKPISNVKDQEVVEAEANKIIKEKINANIKFNLIDKASWEDKMKVMSAAGETYDLCFTSSGTNRLDVAVQRETLKPLNELLDKYGANIKKKVDPRAWKATTYSGKIMAIPSQSPFSSPSGFAFKKDLVEKYKFDYKKVKTLDDLEPYLETIKKNEPNIIPICTVNASSIPGTALYDITSITKGIVYNEKNGKIEISLESADMINITRKINDFYKKDILQRMLLQKPITQLRRNPENML